MLSSFGYGCVFASCFRFLLRTLLTSFETGGRRRTKYDEQKSTYSLLDVEDDVSFLLTVTKRSIVTHFLVLDSFSSLLLDWIVRYLGTRELLGLLVSMGKMCLHLYP